MEGGKTLYKGWEADYRSMRKKGELSGAGGVQGYYEREYVLEFQYAGTPNIRKAGICFGEDFTTDHWGCRKQSQ